MFRGTVDGWRTESRKPKWRRQEAGPSTTIPTATPACPAPALSQLLLLVGDPNWYALAPGETTDNFTGAGWTYVLTAGGKTGDVQVYNLYVDPRGA